MSSQSKESSETGESSQQQNLNNSSDSTGTFTSVSSSLPISVSSESSLLVPGKLHSEIVSLKQCYTRIIHEINQVKSNKTQVPASGQILMLNKEQIVACMKKQGYNAPNAKAHLADLLDNVRSVCLPDYQIDNRPKRTQQDTQITDLTSRVETLCQQNKSDFEGLKTDLETLKSSLSNFEKFASASHPPSQPPVKLIEMSDSDPYIVQHSVPHLDKYVEGFIPASKCEELLSALSDLPYVKQKGREVMKFGENYTFNGSRENSNVDLPPLLKELLDRLNTEFASDHVPPLNSCVVTKYVGPNSFIPPHSDNERCIHPDSAIFTISLDNEVTVSFTDLHNGASHKQQVKPGSLYIMSRLSQSFYKHATEKNPSWGETDSRISLTFRSVHWRNNNSTVIIGDSNTAGLKFASFGKKCLKGLHWHIR